MIGAASTGEDINGLKEQTVTLMDQIATLTATIEELKKTIGELKEGATEQQTKIETVNRDLYESPQFVSAVDRLQPNIAMNTGILTNETVTGSPRS